MPILGLWQNDQSDDNYLRKIVINKSVHEYDHGPRSRALRRFPGGIMEAWEGRSVTKCRLWAQTVTSLRQDDDVAEEEVSSVDQDHCTVKPWRCESFAKMSKSFELCSRTLKLIMRSWEKASHWSRTYFSSTVSLVSDFSVHWADSERSAGNLGLSWWALSRLKQAQGGSAKRSVMKWWLWSGRSQGELDSTPETTRQSYRAE